MDQPDSALPGRSPAVDRWVTAGIVAICLSVYLRSLLPGIGYSGDTAKWQFLGQVGGVPHPTGYPLYLAVNKVWVTLIPWGSLAWKVNLLSAVLGSAAVALLYRLARLLGIGVGVAAASVLVAAFARTFWTQAVIAEVYTLHLALMTGAVICLARWRLGGGDRWLLAGLAVYLLGFGNHMGTVLLLPGVLWLLWSDRRRALTVRNGCWVALFAAIGAAQYLYVVYSARAGRYVEHAVDGPGDLISYVTGSYFKDQMFAFGPAELATTRSALTIRFLYEEYFLLLPLIAYGLWRAFAPDRSRTLPPGHRDVLLLLALWALSAWLFAVNYDIPNVIVYFLPVFYVLALFLALALDDVAHRVRTASERRPGRGLLLVGASALIALPVATALIDYRRASQRGNVVDAERIERALDAAGTEAVLVTDGYLDSEYIWYYLLGEERAATHDLAMAHMVTPDQVVAYFAGEPGPVAAAARRAGARNGCDCRPPIYTATASQAADLRDVGLHVIEVAPDVWRIDDAGERVRRPTTPGL